MAAATISRMMTATATQTKERMMPLDNVRYRVKTTKKGEKIRLAFTKGGSVIEAKNLGTGATHTPAEFADDAKKRKKNLRHAMTGGY